MSMRDYIKLSALKMVASNLEALKNNNSTEEEKNDAISCASEIIENMILEEELKQK